MRNKRNNWKSSRPTEHLEPKYFEYYIFCEGQQTEPNYFNGFKELIDNNPIYEDMVRIEIEPCGAETLRVIYQAEEYVRKHSLKKAQIWCVYDKDSFPAEHFNAVEERAKVLNQRNEDVQYYCAWSNECIEFWFILHFSFYHTNNPREDYIRYLDNRFRREGLGKYQKNMSNIFSILMDNGNPRLAVKYAQRIINENKGKTPTNIAPGTKVYELVLELAKYLPREYQGRFMSEGVLRKQHANAKGDCR